MYAVIRAGGKQYRVNKGQNLRIEMLNAAVGDTVELSDVLMVADGSDVRVGTPLITDGKVTAIIKAQGRAEKINILKFHRRKHYMKRQGHRQSYTEIEITDIRA